jgi:hypothetical protein
MVLTHYWFLTVICMGLWCNGFGISLEMLQSSDNIALV